MKLGRVPRGGSILRSGFEDSYFLCDGREDFEGLIDLGSGVLAGHDGANAGLAFRNGGEGDAGGHDSSVEEGAGEVHGAATGANDDGSDGGFALWGGVAADVEARVGELLLEVVSVVPETLDSFGLVFEDVEGGDAGGGD